MYNINTQDVYEFASNFQMELCKFDTDSYKHAYGCIFNESKQPIPNISSGGESVDIIDSGLSDLKNIADANADDLLEFYTSVKDSELLNKTPINMVIPNTAEIDKIRPQYLSTVVAVFSNAIKRFLSKEISKDEMELTINQTPLEKAKKIICKTEINTSMDIGELARTSSGESVKVNTTLVLNRIIPFLSSFYQQQSALVREANAVKIEIVKASTAMQDIITAINASGVAELGNEKSFKMNKFVYRYVRDFIELRSYAALLMTRKILIFTHTMFAYFELYNTLVKMYPEGTQVLHESVMDGDISTDTDDLDIYNDMTQGEASCIALQAQENLEKWSHILGRSLNFDDYPPETLTYNDDPYSQVIDVYNSLTARLTDFTNDILNGEDFDSVCNKLGFNQPLCQHYDSAINSINTSFPTPSESVTASDCVNAAYAELMYMAPANGWINRIKYEILNTKRVIDDNIDKLEKYPITNVDRSIPDIVLDDAKTFLNGMQNQFKELVVKTAKVLSGRLDVINDIFERSVIEKESAPIVVSEFTNVAIDYNMLIEESARDTIERKTHDVFREYAMKYIAKRNIVNEGVNTVFEDTAAPDSSENTVNSTQSSTTGSAKAIWTAIKDFFKKLWPKATNAASKLAANNSKFFEDHEEALNSMDLSNFNVKMLPFDTTIMSKDHIQSDVNKLTERVKGLDRSKLNNSDNLTMTIYGDGFIPLNKIVLPKKYEKNKDNFPAKLRQYYTIGTAEYKDISVGSDDLKRRIPIMITYCKGYGTLVEDISKMMNNAEKEITNKMMNITNLNESVDTSISGIPFFEETSSPDTTSSDAPPKSNASSNNDSVSNNSSGNGDDKKPSVEVKPGAKPTNINANSGDKETKAVKKLQRDFMQYSASVTNAARDTYFAYMSVLKQLIKTTESASEEKAEKPESGDSKPEQSESEPS